MKAVMHLPSSNSEPVEVIPEVIEKAGYKPGEQVCSALDPAASELYDESRNTTFRAKKVKD